MKLSFKKVLSVLIAAVMTVSILTPVSAEAGQVTDAARLTYDKTTFEVGEAIMFGATDAGSSDWISINAYHTQPAAGQAYQWMYVQDNVNKYNVADPANDENGGQWPVNTAAGTWTVYLCKDGGYDYCDSVDIEIVNPSGGSTEPTVDKTLLTNKGREDVKYEWGEAIMVGAENAEAKDWIGLYAKGETPGGGTSAYYYDYPASYSDLFDIYNKNTARDGVTVPGEYTLFLCANDGYNVLDQVDITIKAPYSSLTLDKEKNSHYEWNENIIVTAEATIADSWVGMIKRGANVDEYANYFTVVNNQATDIRHNATAGVKEVTPGRWNVVLFYGSGYSVDTIFPIWIDRTYTSVEWQWADDFSSANAVLSGALDLESTDPEYTKTVAATIESSVDAQGKTTYTATAVLADSGEDNDAIGYALQGAASKTLTDTKVVGSNGEIELPSDPLVVENPVAMIGETGYATLEEAIAAAVDGDTIILVDDIVLTSDITLTAPLRAKTAITVSTDGVADRTIDTSAITAAYPIQANPDAQETFTITFAGSESSRLIIDGKNVSNSKALVLSQRCNSAFDHVTIKNANGTGNGGAMYVTTGKATISNCSFEDNTTASVPSSNNGGGGGAIYATNSGRMDISDSSFINNSVTNAKAAGGAIYGAQSGSGANLSEITVNNSTFICNSAVRDGVAVFANGKCDIDDCLFIDNAAEYTDINSGNTYTDERTIDGSIFTKTSEKACANESFTKASTKANYYNAVPAPFAKDGAVTESDFDGNAVNLDSFIDGLDTEKMNVAITRDSEAATEIRTAGAYTIVITAKEGGALLGNDLAVVESVTFTYTVNAVQITEYVAQIGETQYGTLGEALTAAEAGATVILLKDIDTAVIDKNVVLTGDKTVTNATVTAAALPLDLTNVTFTNTTFNEVAANTAAFTGTFAGKFGTLANGGMEITEAGLYTYADYEAKIGDARYASLAEAVGAAADDQTIVIVKTPITLPSKLTISKAITVTTDGNGPKTIYAAADFTDGWAIELNTKFVTFGGASEDSRLILDGQNNARSRGLLYISDPAGSSVSYLTVQNSNSTAEAANGGAIYSGKAGEGKVTFDHIIIQNCYNAGNGTLALVNAQNQDVTNSSFLNNTADGRTAGINITNTSAIITIDNCIFSGNATTAGTCNDLYTQNSKDTVSNCTFDHTRFDAAGTRNFTDTNNNFVSVEITAPVQTIDSMVETGSAIAIADIFTGYDSTTMTVAIEDEEGPVTEIIAVGEYTITFAPKDHYNFPAGAETEFTFTVEAAAVNVASYNGTEYTTLGAAIAAAGAGDTVTLLMDIDTAVIDKNVILAGDKTIADATVAAAALPLDLTGVTLTAVTFDGVALNTKVFTGTWEGKFGITLAEGEEIAKDAAGDGFYTISNFEATIGEARFATLADAVAAAAEGDTVVITKTPITLSAQLSIEKAITVTTDGTGDKVINVDPSFNGATWAVQLKAFVNFGGTGEDSRIILDGSNGQRGRGLLYVNSGAGSMVSYVTVQNVDTSATGNNGGAVHSGVSTFAEKVTFDHLTIQNCVSAGAGLLTLANAQTQEVLNSSFLNNTAAGRTAGINMSNTSAVITIDGCTFSGNSTSAGTTVDLYTQSTYNTVSNSTFDHTLTVATGNRTFTDGGGNTFATEGLAIPTAKANVTFTGLELTIDMMVDGFDADKMTYAIAPTPVKEPGVYTVTFTAAEGQTFVSGETTAQVEVTVNAPAPETPGEVTLSMGAEVGETITAVFFAEAPAATVDQYDSVVLRAQLGSDAAIELTGNTVAGGLIQFNFEEIYSQCMAEKITGQVIGRKAGQDDQILATITEGISIADYCDAVAATYPDDEKLLAFMANMLEFGAECQKYLGENTGLANEGHAWADGKVTTTAPASPVDASAISVLADGWDAEDGRIDAVGLNIANKIAIYYKVVLADATGATLTVSAEGMADQVFDLAAGSPAITVNGNEYTVLLDRIDPDQYNTVFTAVLAVGGNAAHTVKYSVNTYLFGAQEGDLAATVGALATAAYNFGLAAEAYN